METDISTDGTHLNPVCVGGEGRVRVSVGLCVCVKCVCVKCVWLFSLSKNTTYCP